MPQAARVLAPSERHGRALADTLILDSNARNASKLKVTGVKGGVYEIALDAPRRLNTDDLIALDDGRLLEVVAAAEPLLEARAADLAGLARLAWQLGDRHVPVQVMSNRIRVRGEERIAALLAALGAKVIEIEAPFEPEGGAYASAHAHDHSHAHHDDGHGHGHHQHDH